MPLAGGQVGGFSLAASPAEQSAHPGEHALVALNASNPSLLPQSANLRATGTSWNATFTPASLTVPANGWANATLDLLVPDNATTNATFTIGIEAADPTTGNVLASASVNVTVVALPAPSPNGVPPPPSAPDVQVSIAASSGTAGTNVTGTLTLVDKDPADELPLRLAIGGAPSWSPRLGLTSFVRMTPNSVKTLPLLVTIPRDAGNATLDFPVTVTVEGTSFQYEATWTVTSVAAPPAAPSGSEAAPQAQPSAPTPVLAQPNLALVVASPVDPILPGVEARGLVSVQNTGNVPLHVRLASNAGDGWTSGVSPGEIDLAAGEAQTVTLTVRAPDDVGGAKEGHAVALLTATSADGLSRFLNVDLTIPPIDASARVPGAVVAPPSPQSAEPSLPTTPASLGLAAGLAAVGAGALVLLHRPTREKILWLGIGLYTRLARPDVLGHEERERLYKIVEAQPGVHFHALQRELGWNTGTLTYHLRVLEKHGFVVDRRDGLYRRFYLSGAAPRKETFENLGPQGLRGDVLEAVRGRHGLSQTDLALALGANKQTVNYHVKALERQGLIRVEKRGRETFLFPSDAAPGATGEAHA